VNRTRNLGSSASWLAWEPSSKQIVFTEHIDGGSGIARVDLERGVNHLWKGAEHISAEDSWSLSVSASRDRRTFALVRHSFEQPPEVWVGPLGKWQAVTRANQDIRGAWGKARSLHWKSDSFRIQGWLLYPQNFDPKQRSPFGRFDKVVPRSVVHFAAPLVVSPVLAKLCQTPVQPAS
jgi:dipeptidyl aminopeptidase/acylaminoacyl peptidase